MQSSFSERRRLLLERLDPGTLVLISSAPIVFRNASNPYPYRQRSDFYYLTGFLEPDAVALLRMTHHGPQFILFNQPKDPRKEQWDGFRVGQLGACMDYGVDESYLIGEYASRLPDYLAECKSVCFLMGQDQKIEEQLRISYSALTKHTKKVLNHIPAHRWLDLASYLHPLRLFKQVDEIQCLRQAASISVDAHKNAMRACQPGRYEYEIESLLMQTFFAQGARNIAYNSIVASGSNACILHYQANQALLEEGQLLLIDAGCEYQYYASDITRTFPVNGRFTALQRDLYQVVLAAQEAVIQAIRPGVCWRTLEETMATVLTEGLVGLGLLIGSIPELLLKQAYRRFCPHRLGHWLGLDVHDVGDDGQTLENLVLQAGMVFTIEPGLYILPDRGIDPKWYGIGIRIEDEVWVTETGCEVLSAAVPKTVEGIEDLMRS